MKKTTTQRIDDSMNEIKKVTGICEIIETDFYLDLKR